MRRLRIAIIGFGKIAADQHVPAIAGNKRFELAATVNRHGNGPAPCFTSHGELLAAGLELDAVAIATPPGARYEIASDCIAAGLHVLLEKPPSVTLSEIADLACLAEGAQLSLFASWHAQHNGAVAAAARALAGKRIASMEVVWHEDVRKWHPGQDWIFEAGGFGVFDPGINAFSILATIFPGSLFVREAVLTYPANRQAPIAAEIGFSSPVADGPLTCSLDWRCAEGEQWTIAVRTADGMALELSEGGKRLATDGQEPASDGRGEYPDIYDRFVDLIDTRRSRVDATPLRLVADALLVGTRETTQAFED
ncbi:MAG: Gfo/Idh/MocA family oxidoreductase [Pseudomonadota bacterium]|nr:Gfo/Idh/MocA family oxidoreductase [Pseudomonadota bacterium]